MTHIVLIRPEIPPNTGNIGRLCAATRSTLHLVGPLGFSLDEKSLRRAGLDYWPLLNLKLHNSLPELIHSLPQNIPIWCIETGQSPSYHTIDFPRDCAFIFGPETVGLSEEIISQLGGNKCHIPMLEPGVRSLNLSNSVAIILYEHLRKHQFIGN